MAVLSYEALIICDPARQDGKQIIIQRINQNIRCDSLSVYRIEDGAIDEQIYYCSLAAATSEWPLLF